MYKSIMMTILMLITLPSLAAAQFVTAGASVTIDTVEVQPGQSFALPVRLAESSLNFAGMQLPLQFERDVVIDSVSFAGSLKPGGSIAAVEIDAVSDTVAISYYPSFSPPPFATVDAAEGVLATIHGTVEADAAEGLIEVDSISGGTGDLMWTGIGFSDDVGSGMYVPNSVVAGGLVVLSPTSVDDSRDMLPGEFALAQNYPNPFNPTTTIEFALPEAGYARLSVFNVLGQVVATPVEGRLSAGNHKIVWDAGQEPSGVYFYRLEHASGNQTRKMVLLK